MPSSPGRMVLLACLALTFSLTAQGGPQDKGRNPTETDKKSPGNGRDVPLPPGARFRLGTPNKHGHWIRGLSFSPDGKRLASAGGLDHVRLWDVATGELLATLGGAGKTFDNVAFAHDGKSLLAYDEDGVIYQWGAVSHKLIRRYPHLQREIYCLVVIPGGDTFATHSYQNVILWSASSGLPVQAFPLDALPTAREIAFSPGGRLLAVLDHENTVRLLDVAAGKVLRQFSLTGAGGRPGSGGIWINSRRWARLPRMMFTPDGLGIAALDDRGKLHVLDADTGRQLRQYDDAGAAQQGFTATPDGRTVLAVGRDKGSVRLCDVTTGKQRRLEFGEGGDVVALSPACRTLAVVDNDHWVQLYDLAVGRPIRVWERPDHSIRGAVLSPDGSVVATEHSSQPPQLWDARTGLRLSTLDYLKSGCQPILLAAGGKTLATVHPEPTTFSACVWDLSARTETCRLPDKEWPISFSPDGKTLLTCREKKKPRLWDAATGKLLCEPDASGGDSFRDFAFSPDGKLLAATADYLTVRVWLTASGGELRRWEPHWRHTDVNLVGLSYSLAFANGGKELRFAGDAHGVQCWDVASGKQLPSIPAPREDWNRLSADGSTLFCRPIFASDSERRGLTICDLASGRRWQRVIELDANLLAWEGISADGSTLMFNHKGTVLLWDTAELIARADRPAEGHAPPPRHGDRSVAAPPDGAVHRLGSTNDFFPSPQQASACALRHGCFDPLPGFFAFAPDGRHYALASPEGAVGLFEPGRDRPVRTWRLPADAWRYGQPRLAVPPSGTALAVFSCGFIHLWDYKNGNLLHRLPTDIEVADALCFSPDGKRVAAAGQTFSRDGPTVLGCWETATGRSLAPLRGHEGNVQELAFSADGRRLYAGGYSEFRVLFPVLKSWAVSEWDLESSQLTNRWSGPAGRSFVRLSPDGRRVVSRDGKNVHIEYLESKDTSRPLGSAFFPDRYIFSHDARVTLGRDTVEPVADEAVQVWDAANGKLLRSVSGPQWMGSGLLELSPDGKLLAWQGTRGVRFWNLAEGREVRPAGGHVEAVRALAFAPGGKLLASGGDDGDLVLWDPGTGKSLQRLHAHRGGVELLAFTADGADLVSVGDGGVAVWGVAKRVERGRWKPEVTPGAPLALSADGTALAGAQQAGVAVVWEARTGKESRRFQSADGALSLLGLSPDGALLAAVTGAGMDKIQLWHVPSGKALHTLSLPNDLPYHPDGSASCRVIAITADGRFLVTGERPKDLQDTVAVVRLWEVATAKQVCRLETRGAKISSLALPPDGTNLLQVDSRNGGQAILSALFSFADSVRLSGFSGEAACLTSRRALKALGDGPSALLAAAFAPDGKTVATGGQDGTVLVWNVAQFLEPPAAPTALAEGEREKLWQAVAGSDAAAAWRAVARLASDREGTVAFLKPRLPPAAPPDPDRVTRLIEDLGSDRFAARDQAARALGELSELVIPQLEKALAAGPTLERQRRLERLLSEARQSAPEGDRLRQLRAVALLERIGDAAAVQLLRQLAQGYPAARSTLEARAALDRISRRTSPP